MKTTSLFVPLLTAAFVSAHGFLKVLTINGKVYNGNAPSAPDKPSVIRQISDPSPIKGANNKALTCGPGSTAADLVADANPGDALTYKWVGVDGIANWIHKVGPIMTYLANCGSTTCDKFDSSEAKWFKIQQLGKKPSDPSQWVMADLMAGGVANGALPQNLAAGNYLLRNELLALHVGNALGGAEYYASCAQIKVGGSKTGAPTSNELVSLPGAYNDNDPGIFDKNIFDPGAPYTFPGPSVAAFVGAKTSGNSSTPSTTTTPPSTSSKASRKSCKVKRASPTLITDVAPRKRHPNRMMQRLGFKSRH